MIKCEIILIIGYVSKLGITQTEISNLAQGRIGYFY